MCSTNPLKKYASVPPNILKLRHDGPTNLQYRFPYMKELDNTWPKALTWIQAPPTPCPPIMT